MKISSIHFYLHLNPNTPSTLVWPCPASQSPRRQIAPSWRLCTGCPHARHSACSSWRLVWRWWPELCCPPWGACRRSLWRPGARGCSDGVGLWQIDPGRIIIKSHFLVNRLSYNLRLKITISSNDLFHWKWEVAYIHTSLMSVESFCILHNICRVRVLWVVRKLSIFRSVSLALIL